jgi:hypothetical protein
MVRLGFGVVASGCGDIDGAGQAGASMAAFRMATMTRRTVAGADLSLIFNLQR